MIYGMWLSATGVMTSSHTVDTIANNLANAETSGFKRQLAVFQERPPEGKENPARAGGDRFFDNIGGGQLLAPSFFDQSAGALEATDKNLDVAIQGDGYFMVKDANGEQRLTRNGNFMADRENNLVLATDPKAQVLDANRQPIKLDPTVNAQSLDIADDGTMQFNNQTVGRLGMFNVADANLLRPVGGTLFKAPASVKIDDFKGQVSSGYLERSNVDPAIELTKMMEAQRGLEANANMIRYQDQSMSRLVSDVGRIG